MSFRSIKKSQVLLRNGFNVINISMKKSTEITITNGTFPITLPDKKNIIGTSVSEATTMKAAKSKGSRPEGISPVAKEVEGNIIMDPKKLKGVVKTVKYSSEIKAVKVVTRKPAIKKAVTNKKTTVKPETAVIKEKVIAVEDSANITVKAVKVVTIKQVVKKAVTNKKTTVRPAINIKKGPVNAITKVEGSEIALEKSVAKKGVKTAIKATVKETTVKPAIKTAAVQRTVREAEINTEERKVQIGR
jgi:hypothetical protein